MMKISVMSDRLQAFFIGQADCMAWATFFVRRTSKLTGSVFLQGLVFGWLEHPTASLNDLAAFLHAHAGVQVTPQGLDERIHRYTVDFMKKMFQVAVLLFCHAVHLPVPLLTQFTGVNITDSTGIALPACLAKRWPGSGGNASPAGLKVQLVFEFLSGTFSKVWLTNGITPDQATTGHLRVVRRGSLNLFDLGYFVVAHLKAIAEKGAYFLCRFLLSTSVYDTDGHKLDLVAWLRTEKRDRFEIPVQIGSTLRRPCRLCCFRAPEEVVNRRRRQAKAQAKKKGRTPSKRTLALLGWTLLVTNAPVSMVTLEQVALLYALRWQVELVFKLWKSQMRLDHIAGVRKERVQVELYAKLIGLVLFRFLAMPLRAKDIDLSPTKAFKRVTEYSGRLLEGIHSIVQVRTLLEQMQEAILLFARREKRKTRVTTVQQLILGGDYYA